MKNIFSEEFCKNYFRKLDKDKIKKIFDNNKNSVLRNHLIFKYIEYFSDLRIFILFPKRNKKLDKIFFTTLNKYGFIFLKKKLEITNLTHAFNLLRLIFQNESWIGNFGNFYENAKSNLGEYFTNKERNLEIILFCPKSSIFKKKKFNVDYQEIMNIYKSKLYSVYVSIDHQLTSEFSKFLFHYNSVIMYSKRMDRFFLNFEKTLITIKESYININDFVFTGSAVMSALGLREPNDLDIFHKNDFILPKFLSSDNSKIKFTNYTIEELLFDPRRHFYYMGLKFINPKILLELKNARYSANQNPKDNKDIKILKNFLSLKQ